MQHRVLWAPDAEEKLEQILKRAADPGILAAAAREIDQQLIATPTVFGESRYDTVRIGFVFPLGVQFEVMDDVRTVIVHDVWRVDRR